MKAAFYRSQQQLNRIQSLIKQRLEQIQYLDVECLRIECQVQQLRQAYLQQIKYQYINDDEQQVNIEDIAKLEEQLKQLAQKKVFIAQQIEQIVAKCTIQIERQMLETVQQFTNQTKNIRDQIKIQHLSQFGITKNKTKQQKIMSSQIKAIVKEYYDEKQTQNPFHGQTYCVCKPTSKSLFSGNMIECQNPTCKVGWFHFECVGIKFDNVPNHWICQLCESQIKNIKKVTFEQQNQKIQLQISKKTNVQNQYISMKRKRGRPRKSQ